MQSSLVCEVEKKLGSHRFGVIGACIKFLAATKKRRATIDRLCFVSCSILKRRATPNERGAQAPLIAPLIVARLADALRGWLRLFYTTHPLSITAFKNRVAAMACRRVRVMEADGDGGRRMMQLASVQPRAGTTVNRL